MAPRWFIQTLAMAIGLAIPELCLTPIGADRAIHPNDPSRQEPAADPASTTRVSGTPEAAPAEIDVATAALSLGGADLRRMLAAGRLALDLPDGTRIDLEVNRSTRRHAADHFRLHDGSYASTLTLRGDRFFAHLVTATGSYRIDGNAAGARVYAQRAFDQRTLGFEKDYRHVPH